MISFLKEIGRAYLNYLIEEEAFDEAGQLCVKILGRKKELWEEEIYKFAKIKQLKVNISACYHSSSYLIML